MSAQALASKGAAAKDMDRVKSGNILLGDVNSKLPKALECMREIDCPSSWEYEVRFILVCIVYG